MREILSEAIYSGDVKLWNQRKKEFQERSEEYIHLEHIDLSGKNLTGINLSYCKINRASFRNADLQRADLSNTELRRCDFKHSNLQNATFQNAHCTDADFRSANCTSTDFSNSDLRGSLFRGGTFSHATFHDSKMQDVNARSTLLLDRKTESISDLRASVGLSQVQLDVMLGDTGTLIPEKLLRPVHWPIWDPTGLAQRILKAGPLPEILDLDEDGKVFATHTPPNDLDHYESSLNRVSDAVSDLRATNAIGQGSHEIAILQRALKTYRGEPLRVHDDFVLVRDALKHEVESGTLPYIIQTRQLLQALDNSAIDIRNLNPEVSETIKSRGEIRLARASEEEISVLRDNLRTLELGSVPTKNFTFPACYDSCSAKQDAEFWNGAIRHERSGVGVHQSRSPKQEPRRETGG